MGDVVRFLLVVLGVVAFLGGIAFLIGISRDTPGQIGEGSVDDEPTDEAPK